MKAKLSSDNIDLWTSIGTIVSTGLSVFAWLNAIGLVPLFTFIAGVFFSLWTQERIEKRREKRDFNRQMTSYAFGPLHKELNTISINLERFQTVDEAPLDRIIDDFRFNLIEEKLKARIRDFCDRLPHYNVLWSIANNETNFHISMAMDKRVSFAIMVGSQEFYRYDLWEPIFKGKEPLEFLTEKGKQYQDTSIIVYVENKSEGYLSNDQRISKISRQILTTVVQNPKIQEQRNERENLLKECHALIKLAAEKIVL